MSLMATHIELLKQEVELYDRTGVFLQDWFVHYESGKRTYLGDKKGVYEDPVLSTNSFRRMMRLHAKEKKVPFIHARRHHNWRRKDTVQDVYEVVIPNQKRLDTLLARYRMQWALQQEEHPPVSIWDAKYTKPVYVDIGRSITTLYLDHKNWSRFLTDLQEEPTHSVLKLAAPLQRAA